MDTVATSTYKWHMCMLTVLDMEKSIYYDKTSNTKDFPVSKTVT